MDVDFKPESGRMLLINLNRPDELHHSVEVFKALASEIRVSILKHLSVGPANVKEIADAFQMPISTATLHVKSLEQAGLIHTEKIPAERGLQKVCSPSYHLVVLQLPVEPENDDNSIQVEIPIGSYSDCHVEPTCGLVGDHGLIGMVDDPSSFYEPARTGAQMLWFRVGYIEYRFPNRLPAVAHPTNLTVSMEICSEAPLNNPEWDSDITFWVNDVELGSWTSHSDFGEKRGLLTPDWWDSWNTQYGLLKQVLVNEQGTYIDGMRISDVNVHQLNLMDNRVTTFRVGVKPDSQNVGGLNLFGRTFGNYPQDIVFKVRYERRPVHIQGEEESPAELQPDSSGAA
ncbi:MAG: helix-turn-helix domain-containing protein [Chloroflexi bacterium]|nr:helix-turn-helix domain-containing protein [Chloroflexota bacterium]